MSVSTTQAKADLKRFEERAALKEIEGQATLEQWKADIKRYEAKSALESYMLAAAQLRWYDPRDIYKPLGGRPALQKRMADSLSALELAMAEVQHAMSAECLETNCKQLAAVMFAPAALGDTIAEKLLAGDSEKTQEVVVYWFTEEVDFVTNWYIRVTWRRKSSGTTTFEDIQISDIHCTGRNDCRCVVEAANRKLEDAGKSPLTGLYSYPAGAAATAAAEAAAEAAAGAAAAAAAASPQTDAKASRP